MQTVSSYGVEIRKQNIPIRQTLEIYRNAVELSECLTRLKDTLDKEREEKLNVKKLEDYFQEALPALKSNFLISLIEGRVSEEDYKRFLTAYQVDMKGPLFCCVVFHTSANHVPEGMDSLLLSM